jgi:hypothetical protein
MLCSAACTSDGANLTPNCNPNLTAGAEDDAMEREALLGNSVEEGMANTEAEASAGQYSLN